MILTITPNPALDVTYRVANLVVGSTLRVDAPQVKPGGKGLNVARVLTAQDIPNVSLTTQGGDSGARFASELDRMGLEATLVEVDGDTRSTIAIVDESTGDVTLLSEHGADPGVNAWHELYARAETLAPTNGVVVVSGSLPKGVPTDFTRRLIAIAHERGAQAIVDTSGPALVDAAAGGADVLKPNNHELAQATGLSDPVAGANHLLSLGAMVIFVSLGSKGMLAVTDSIVLHATLGRELVGNPTGAGDAAVAALASVFDTARLSDATPDAQRELLEAALRRAVGWSAAAVLMPVAGEIHESHGELADAVTITEITDAAAFATRISRSEAH